MDNIEAIVLDVETSTIRDQDSNNRFHFKDVDWNKMITLTKNDGRIGLEISPQSKAELNKFISFPVTKLKNMIRKIAQDNNISENVNVDMYPHQSVIILYNHGIPLRLLSPARIDKVFKSPEIGFLDRIRVTKPYVSSFQFEKVNLGSLFNKRVYELGETLPWPDPGVYITSTDEDGNMPKIMFKGMKEAININKSKDKLSELEDKKDKLMNDLEDRKESLSAIINVIQRKSSTSYMSESYIEEEAEDDYIRRNDKFIIDNNEDGEDDDDEEDEDEKRHKTVNKEMANVADEMEKEHIKLIDVQGDVISIEDELESISKTIEKNYNIINVNKFKIEEYERIADERAKIFINKH